MLSGIEIESSMGGTYNVFLDLPEGQEPVVGGPHYVGTFGSFALAGSSGHAAHGAGASVTLDATAAVTKLSAAGLLLTPHTVTFVPKGSVTRPPTIASVALVAN